MKQKSICINMSWGTIPSSWPHRPQSLSSLSPSFCFVLDPVSYPSFSPWSEPKNEKNEKPSQHVLFFSLACSRVWEWGVTGTRNEPRSYGRLTSLVSSNISSIRRRSVAADLSFKEHRPCPVFALLCNQALQTRRFKSGGTSNIEASRRSAIVEASTVGIINTWGLTLRTLIG